MTEKLGAVREEIPVEIVEDAAAKAAPPKLPPPDAKLVAPDGFMGTAPPPLMEALAHTHATAHAAAPIDLASAKRFPAFAQFKDLYDLGDGRLLAIAKSSAKASSMASAASSASAPQTTLENEVRMCQFLDSHGVETAHPSLVPVQKGSEVVQGMVMRLVPGNLIDLHKIPSGEVLSRIIGTALLTDEQIASTFGTTRSRLFTEFGLAKYGDAMVPISPDVPENKRVELAASLGQILRLAEAGHYVTDLQGVLEPSGKLTVIDPLALGPLKEMNSGQRAEVEATYARIGGIFTEVMATLSPDARARVAAAIRAD